MRNDKMPLVTLVSDDLLESTMDAHAKRIAISFAEWIHKEEETNGLIGDESFGWYYSQPVVNGPGCTTLLIGNTSDLYELFKKHILETNEQKNNC